MSRRWPLALCGITLFALGWRLLYVYRLCHTPLFDYLEADASAYWHWAAAIRAAHGVARQPFFLAPLYPYALASFQSVFGSSLPVLFCAQALLGALATALLADATRRLSAFWPAVIVGISVAAYAPSVMFDGLVLSESLLFALGSALVWFVVWSEGRSASLRSGLVVGGLVGVMALGRANALLLMIPLAGLLIQRGSTARPKISPLLASLLVIALLDAPVVLHHWRLEHEIIPYTYNLGYNFYVGNGPDATGGFVNPVGYSEPYHVNAATAEGGVDGDGRAYLTATRGRRFSPGASSRAWFGSATRYMADHPWLALALGAYKLGLMLNARDLPQIESPGLYESMAGPLGLPIVGTFVFVGLFGLCGAGLGVRRGGAARRLVGMACVIVMGTAVFFVTDRYRLHLVPAIAPLAGLALLECWALLTASLGARQFWVGGVGVVVAVLLFLPLIPHDPLHDAWERAATLGDVYLSKGLSAQAAVELDHAIAIQERGQLNNAGIPMAKSAMAAVHQSRGLIAVSLGESESAVSNFARAVELVPGYPGLRTQFAAALAFDGRGAEAYDVLRQNAPLARASEELLLTWGLRFESEGQLPLELRALRAAAELSRGSERYAIPLVRALLLMHLPEEAHQQLELAKAAGLDVQVYLAHKAWLLLARGDTEAASAIMKQLRDSNALADRRVAATVVLMEAAIGGARGGK